MTDLFMRIKLLKLITAGSTQTLINPHSISKNSLLLQKNPTISTNFSTSSEKFSVLTKKYEK